MLYTSGSVDDSFTHNTANGQNQRQHVCFVKFARWWHQGRSLRFLSFPCDLYRLIPIETFEYVEKFTWSTEFTSERTCSEVKTGEFQELTEMELPSNLIPLFWHNLRL